MSDLPSPPARRVARPRWTEPRLLLGLLLVLTSVVVGSRVVAGADKTSPVYLARRPLAAGQLLGADDVTVGRARLSASGRRYLRADRPPPAGYVLTRPVGAGELLPIGALSAGAAAATRMVTVPVAPGHLPPGLSAGDAVDVYVTVKPAGQQGPVRPTRVLSGAAVQSRDGGSRGFAASAVVSVVLAVPDALVADVVQAVQTGAIDLVRVPAGAAAAG